MSRKAILLLGVFLAVGVAALPLTGSSTNCGGNSAALSAARAYAQLATFATLTRPDHVFRVTDAIAEQPGQVASLLGATVRRRAHLLVSTAPLVVDSKERRVVIVCDTPYTNVPVRRIGSAPPTHAAGFSDGSTGLISPAEFAKLDWSSFAYINDLLPPDSK